MSLTALVWLCCFLTFAILAFRRPSWGIALYLLVFYIDPNFWWWGRPIKEALGYRFSITAALIFAAAAFLRGPRLRQQERKILAVLLVYAISATVVHLTLAVNPERSIKNLDLLWKNLGLLFLITTSIKDRVDWKIFIWSILIGSLYLGYEMVINGRGHTSGGRLERAVCSGASDSEALAGLLALAVPLGGALFLIGRRWEKVLALVVLVLICETIVRCNTRGTFLALIVGGGWLVLAARGRIRRYALTGCILAALTAVALVRDDSITRRFMSTFASEEERDASAQNRLHFWTAALQMLRDYPLGSGGESAFRSERGHNYIRPYGFTDTMAVHNGYFDIACGWGVQSFLLYALAMYLAWQTLRKAIRYTRQRDDWRTAFLGVCIQTSLVTQLVCAMFLSTFDSEAFFWLIGMMLGFDRVFGPEAATVPVAAATQAKRLPVYGLAPAR